MTDTYPISKRTTDVTPSAIWKSEKDHKDLVMKCGLNAATVRLP
jgi:hypothetical protein